MLSPYRAVFFDAGGTLFHPYPSVGEIYEEVAKKYGSKAKAAELERKFREAWIRRDGIGALDAQLDEKVERQWWKGLVHEVFDQFGGVEDFETFFHDLYDFFARPECWRLYPGTIEVLAKIKKSKKRLAIISNWDSRLFKLCDAFGLNNYFEFVLASAVFGTSKPGKKIFEEALKRTGVQPEEAVHIGDSLEDDVKGAKTVGIHAIWINRHGHLHPSAEHEAVRQIHSIQELIQVI